MKKIYESKGTTNESDEYSKKCWYCKEESFDDYQLISLYKKREQLVSSNYMEKRYHISYLTEKILIPIHNDCKIKADKAAILPGWIMLTGYFSAFISLIVLVVLLINLKLDITRSYSDLRLFGLYIVGGLIFSYCLAAGGKVIGNWIGKKRSNRLGIKEYDYIDYPETKKLLSLGFVIGQPPIK